MTITPYNREQWDAVLSAFRHFLDNRLEYSRKHRQHAIDAMAKRQDAIRQYQADMKALNPERHSTRYLNIPLPMRHGQPVVERTYSLTHYANGVPISWRQFPAPDTYRVPVRLMAEPEQPDHIRLQLEIMNAA